MNRGRGATMDSQRAFTWTYAVSVSMARYHAEHSYLD